MTALEVVAIITTCVCMVFDCICLWVYFCCVFFPRTSCIEVVYFWGSSVIGFFFFHFTFTASYIMQGIQGNRRDRLLDCWFTYICR